MSKLDVEQVLDGVKAIMTANLNAAITALNTEKNDTVSLASIDSSAYFMQSMDGAQANYDPFIFYGVRDLPGEASDYPGDSAYRLEIDVIICVADHGMDVEIGRRMLRYQRVLKEIFERHFDEMPGGCKLSVKSQVPVTIQLLNASHRHKVVGVMLTTEFA